MKYKRNTWKGFLFVAGLVATLGSCRKMLDEWNVLYHVPQSCVCDVASYGPGYDTNFLLPHPYYFQKYYSSSGGQLKEIDFYFENLVFPPPYQQYLVDDQGKKVFIRNKDNPSELVMTIYLNSAKRVDSFRLTSDIGYPPGSGVPLWNGYTYKNNRLWVISGFFVNDTCFYDSKGNLTAIKHFDSYYGDWEGSFYQYDYTRQASQQFYKFGVEYNNGFQLLMYLGYFPELSNPRNLMIHYKDGLEHGAKGLFDNDLFDHKLDSEGKLLSFKWGHLSYPLEAKEYHLTWNCHIRP